MRQDSMYIIRIIMNQPEQKLKFLEWTKQLFQNGSTVANPIGIDFPLSDYEWFVCNQMQYHSSLFSNCYLTEEGLQQLLAHEWTWILNEIQPFDPTQSNQFHWYKLCETFNSLAYRLKKGLMLPTLEQRVSFFRDFACAYQQPTSQKLQYLFAHSCLGGKYCLQESIKSTEKAILKWKTKLEHENFNPNQMYFDFLRFRLSVSRIEECYQAWELLKSHYHIFRFRDYYQKPKQNGLRFLNMNALDSNCSFPFEIQIMTNAMKKTYFDSDDHDQYNERQYYKKRSN